MVCFFPVLYFADINIAQGGVDFKLPVTIETVFDNSPGMYVCTRNNSVLSDLWVMMLYM